MHKQERKEFSKTIKIDAKSSNKSSAKDSKMNKSKRYLDRLSQQQGIAQQQQSNGALLTPSE